MGQRRITSFMRRPIQRTLYDHTTIIVERLGNHGGSRLRNVYPSHCESQLESAGQADHASNKLDGA